MLQKADGVVKSIKEVRAIFANLTDREFAAWYSQRYMITEKRVHAILELLKEEAK